MEKSREGELGGGGVFFLIGWRKAGVRKSIYPREEVSFSASSFLNSSLFGCYFFCIGAMKRDKTARCGPGLADCSQPAEHPISW